MGPGRVLGGARVVPLQHPPSHPSSHHPGYTPLAPGMAARWLHAGAARRNSAVGLKSVDQLSLRLYISGFLGMTEVYNLSVAGNPNDHKLIPQNE